MIELKRKISKSVIVLFVIIFTLSSFNIVNATTYNFNKDTYELIFVKHDLISTNDNAYTLEYLGSTTYWVGNNASFIPITEDMNGINSGFVFRGTNLTQYDEIWSAYLELTFYDDFDLEFGQFITIYGEDVNNASSYSTKADYESRSLTSTNVVMWVEGSYSKDEVWRSTDIKYILQEIVDRSGYGKIDKNNIALRILAEGNSIDRSMYSFDSSVVKSAKLYISSSAYGHCPITVSMNNKQSGYWVYFVYNWDDFDPDYLGEGWRSQLYGWYQYTNSPHEYGDVIDYISGAVKGYSPELVYAVIKSTTTGDLFSVRKVFNFINNTQDAFILSTRTWGPSGAQPALRFDSTPIYGSDANDIWRLYSELIDNGNIDTIYLGGKFTIAPKLQYYDSSIFYFHFPSLEGINITKGSGNTDGEPSDIWIFEDSLGSPQYSDIDFNSTFKGFQTRGVIRWKDKMSELDFSIFSTNYTGSWVNSSYPLSGHDDFAFHDMILPDNETLYYQWYANNTIDNWNSTGILTLDLKDYSFKNANLKDSDGSLNDGWIFRGDTYLFEANFSEASTAIFNFTDGEHEIEFTYNNVTQRLSINSDGQFVIGDYYYNITHYSDGITKATWGFIPNTNIVDINNATIDYTIYNEESGTTLTGNTGINFNIYNLGGFTYYTFVGDGARLPYGSPFSLNATDGNLSSSAKAEQIFRKLQHISFLMEIDMDHEWDDGNGEFDIHTGIGFVDVGFDYRLNGSWVEGFKIRLYVQSADVGHHDGGNDHDWVEWSVDFYNYEPITKHQQNLQSQLIMSNHWGYEHENYVPDYYNRTSSQLWVDLWFDKTNASTTIASQVNSYYYGVKEQGSSWWFGYGVFTPMISDYDNAKFLDDLYDEEGNITNCQKYDLIKFYIEVGKLNYTDHNDESWTIRGIEDMHREQAIDRMEGIDEPTFVQTKALDMPQTGFINALKSAIGGIANAILQGIFFTLKSLWAGVGYVAELMGLKQWYDALSIMIGNIATASLKFMEALETALINSVLLLEQILRMISSGLTRYTTTMTEFITSIISWYTAIVQMFSGGGVWSINIWMSLSLGDWFGLLITLSPVLWINRLANADDLVSTMQGDISFMLMLLTGLFNFLTSIIMLSITLLSFIIGLLPI